MGGNPETLSRQSPKTLFTIKSQAVHYARLSKGRTEGLKGGRRPHSLRWVPLPAGRSCRQRNGDYRAPESARPPGLRRNSRKARIFRLLTHSHAFSLSHRWEVQGRDDHRRQGSTCEWWSTVDYRGLIRRYTCTNTRSCQPLVPKRLYSFDILCKTRLTASEGKLCLIFSKKNTKKNSYESVIFNNRVKIWCGSSWELSSTHALSSSRFKNMI